MALKPELGKRIRLADEEFADLPISALMNIDNFAMFQDYLRSDMWLEMARAFKLNAMKHIQASMLPDDRILMAGGERRELKFLQVMCIDHFLKNDEETYYNSILKDLKPEEKWSYNDTEIYVQCALDELNVNEIEHAIDELLKAENYVRPPSKRVTRATDSKK